MSATTPVYARIDSNLKENAEAILHQLGISPASAIQMLYSQIVLKRGIPFDPGFSDQHDDVGKATPRAL